MVEAIEAGGSQKEAAAAAGITEQTLCRWRREDTAFACRCEIAKLGTLLPESLLSAIKRLIDANDTPAQTPEEPE